MGILAEQLINGVSIGSRLFLIAVGLSLIFGIMGVLNFAHGAFYMVGAYITLSATTAVFQSYWIGLVSGALVVGLLGAIIEFGFLRRIYERELLDQLLLTFAFILIITDLVRHIWGTSTHSMSPPQSLSGSVDLGIANVTSFRLFVIVFSLVAVGVIWYGLMNTYQGKLIRAASSDREMAELLGTNVPRLYTGVFFVGSALAGIGGALAAPLQAVSTSLGDAIIIDAFVVVVIGGLGSFPGAFIGAMLIGLLRSYGIMLFNGADLLLPFVAMILVLIFRPEGLLGGMQE